MVTEKTTTRRPEAIQQEVQEAALAADAPAEELLPRVRSWGGVAREALQDCERGAEAVKKIRLRRNRSGQ